MLSRTALPNSTKVATATAEVLRRIKRTSIYASKETFQQEIKQYMDDLAGMGYQLSWRLEVLRSAITMRKVELGTTTRK